VAQTKPIADVAVIGAGVFGAWTAFMLRQAGARVTLLDQHGAANNRASSGGESRITRAGYGPKEIYTRWSMEALAVYQEFYAATDPTLYQETGFLWMGRPNDAYMNANLAAFRKLGVKHDVLTREEMGKRFPGIGLEGLTWGIFEYQAGGLMARRGVQTVVRHLVKNGLRYEQARVEAPGRGRRVESVAGVKAGQFVFACGPWLPQVFPDLLRGRIRPTRQEVFYFGAGAGEATFRAPLLPAWVDPGDTIYGLPDLENRGFKIAPDGHGPEVDPETQERVVPQASVDRVRAYLRKRFPLLAGAPLTQAEVCQYENTVNGDYLIDRHPEQENVWLLGGGSGHGYKHGPAVGKYTAKLVLEGGRTEEMFALGTKALYDPANRSSTIPGK
jgi:sarcosine oxidase